MSEKKASINEFSPEADFEWKNFENGVVIHRYIGKETDIKIPQQVQGKPVTSIGADAFSRNQLTSITIPNSVTSIGQEAFADNDLTSISLPDSVTFVGFGAFRGNPLVNVKGGPQQDGFFWTKSDDGNSMIITCYTGKETDIKIPSEINGMSVTAIGDGAFVESDLSSIVIPDSITSIGESAFQGNQLTSVLFPNSVTSIGVCAFVKNKLINVSITNFVARVGGCAFDSYVNISGGSQENGFFWTVSDDGKSAIITNYAGSEKNVHIPAQIHGLPVISIEEMAFFSKELYSVVLPNSVTFIGIKAFCFNNLIGITIPDSVIFIGDEAFSCNQLTSIVIPDSVTSIGVFAFARNHLVEVILGNSVFSIGERAFLTNKLTDVAIPNTVVSMQIWEITENKRTNISIPFSTDIAARAFDPGVTITRRNA
jgi:energy-converting hydrogenase Eha subunit A